jgi:glycosyltransferase involved in cell wall biosynthesis
LFKSSRVFVLPSTRKGLGVVLLEASCCGMLVITPDHRHNGARDLIEEGKNGNSCGLDEEQIAGGTPGLLEQGMDNKSSQLSADHAGRCDWNRMANRLEAVI